MRARSGMTLLELVVGLVVAGLVVAAGYAAFGAVIDRREHAAVAARETATAIGVRRMLLQWMDGSTPQIVTSSDAAGAGQLQFLTRGRTPMNTPQTGVRMYVSDGTEAPGRGLVAILRPDVGNDSMRVVIDPTVRAMSFDYLVQSGDAQQWRTADQIQNEQPTAVIALRLQLQSDSPLMVAAYASPIEAALR